MSTYYKTINGLKYDRAMIEKAEISIKGRGDGRISLADTRNIIKLIKDGGRITEIEKRTLSYILENYNFTDTAIKYIEKTLSESLSTDTAKETDTQIKTSDKKQITVKSSLNKKNKNILFLLLFLLICIAVVISITKKNRVKNDKIENTVIEKNDEVQNIQKVETDIKKPDTTGVVPGTTKTENKKIKHSESEYVVKENDTLIKISTEFYNDYSKWVDIYRLNKDNLSKPSIIYPGQILKLPEKKSVK